MFAKYSFETLVLHIYIERDYKYLKSTLKINFFNFTIFFLKIAHFHRNNPKKKFKKSRHKILHNIYFFKIFSLCNKKNLICMYAK